MKRVSKEDMVPDAAIGVFFAVVCLIFFVIFFHFVSKFIQVNYLIHIITDHADQIIQEIRQLGSLEKSREAGAESPLCIYAKQEGYVRYVQIRPMVDLAMQEGLYLKLAPKVGQYAEKGSLLFEVWGSQDSAGLEPALTKNVSLGLDRTNQQDLVYVMEKIIETGLRAISLGINDPNTAIYCIRELSLIIKRLGDWKGSHWIIKDRTGEPRMEIPFYSFEELSGLWPI